MTKWAGSFNWYGEIHQLSTEAETKGSAKRKMCAGLAKKLGVTFSSVYSYFSKGKDNFLLLKKEKNNG